MVEEPIVVWSALKFIAVVGSLVLFGGALWELLHLFSEIRKGPFITRLDRIVSGVEDARVPLAKPLRRLEALVEDFAPVSGPTIQPSLEVLIEPLRAAYRENLIEAMGNTNTRRMLVDALNAYSDSVRGHDLRQMHMALSDFGWAILRCIGESTRPEEAAEFELVEDLGRCSQLLRDLDPGAARSIINKWNCERLKTLGHGVLVPALLARNWLRNIYFDPPIAGITGDIDRVRDHYEVVAEALDCIASVLKEGKDPTSTWWCVRRARAIWDKSGQA